MASNNTLANGQDDSSHHSNADKLLGEAHQDLASQQHRILPNLTLLQGFFRTYLAGGIIDDRKYIVTYLTFLQSFVGLIMLMTLSRNRSKTPSNWLRLFPMGQPSATISTTHSLPTCGTICSTLRSPTWARVQVPNR